MKIIENHGTEPFAFSYGGKSYIIPPKQGGIWKQETIQTITRDPQGRMVSHDVQSRIVRVDDPKKPEKVGINWCEVKDDTAFKAAQEIRRQHRTDIKFKTIEDVASKLQQLASENDAYEAEIAALKAKLASKPKQPGA